MSGLYAVGLLLGHQSTLNFEHTLAPTQGQFLRQNAGRPQYVNLPQLSPPNETVFGVAGDKLLTPEQVAPWSYLEVNVSNVLADTYTLPTASSITAFYNTGAVGDNWYIWFNNLSDNAITLADNTGSILTDVNSIPPSTMYCFMIHKNNASSYNFISTWLAPQVPFTPVSPPSSVTVNPSNPPSSTNFTTIQGAIDDLHGKTVLNTEITVAPGTYAENVLIRSISVTYGDNFRLLGDLRDVAALGYAHGCVWNPTTTLPPVSSVGGGKGVIADFSASTLSSITVKRDASSAVNTTPPNFAAAGVVAGDILIIRSINGVFSERTVTSVSTNTTTGDTINFTPALATAANGLHAGFQVAPNRIIAPTTGTPFNFSGQMFLQGFWLRVMDATPQAHLKVTPFSGVYWTNVCIYGNGIGIMPIDIGGPGGPTTTSPMSTVLWASHIRIEVTTTFGISLMIPATSTSNDYTGVFCEDLCDFYLINSLLAQSASGPRVFESQNKGTLRLDGSRILAGSSFSFATGGYVGVFEPTDLVCLGGTALTISANSVLEVTRQGRLNIKGSPTIGINVTQGAHIKSGATTPISIKSSAASCVGIVLGPTSSLGANTFSCDATLSLADLDIPANAASYITQVKNNSRLVLSSLSGTNTIGAAANGFLVSGNSQMTWNSSTAQALTATTGGTLFNIQDQSQLAVTGGGDFVFSGFATTVNVDDSSESYLDLGAGGDIITAANGVAVDVEDGSNVEIVRTSISLVAGNTGLKTRNQSKILLKQGGTLVNNAATPTDSDQTLGDVFTSTGTGVVAVPPLPANFHTADSGTFLILASDICPGSTLEFDNTGTYTMPIASDITTAYPYLQDGQSYNVFCQNWDSAGPVVILGNTGVTLPSAVVIPSYAATTFIVTRISSTAYTLETSFLTRYVAAPAGPGQFLRTEPVDQQTWDSSAIQASDLPILGNNGDVWTSTGSAVVPVPPPAANLTFTDGISFDITVDNICPGAVFEIDNAGTYTMPTAAALTTAYPYIQDGSSWNVAVTNWSFGTATIVGNTGVVVFDSNVQRIVHATWTFTRVDSSNYTVERSLSAPMVNASSDALSAYAVRSVYLYDRDLGGGIASVIQTAVDRGFNVVILAFYENLAATAAVSLWEALGSGPQQTVLDYIHERGAKLLLGVGGAGDNTWYNTVAATWAANVATYASANLYDGCDLDLEGIASGFTAGATLNTAALLITWLSDVTTGIRSQMLLTQSNVIVTHAPQAPYFGANGSTFPNPFTGTDGGYTNIQGYVDWFNVQFYNQGASTPYDTFTKLFVDSGSSNPGTAVQQIMSYGVPGNKIVIGKPLIVSDASNGWVTGRTFGEIIRNARRSPPVFLSSFLGTNHWSAGFSLWQWQGSDVAALFLAYSIIGT